MEETLLRKTAVELMLSGLGAVEIASRTGKSRQWVHKWIKRYQSNPDGDWSASHSRAPLVVANKTPAQVAALVVRSRKKLEGTKYAQTGATSIRYDMQSEGLGPVPQDWTINRILSREGLVRGGGRVSSQKKTTLPLMAGRTRWILWAPGT